MAKTATKLKSATTTIKPSLRSTALVPVEKQQVEAQDRSPLNWWPDIWNYQVDAWQRSVLFLDTLRQRADNMIEHEKNGMPPLLDFKYEMALLQKSVYFGYTPS